MLHPTFNIVEKKSLGGQVPANTAACVMAVDQDRAMIYIYGGFQLPVMDVPLGDLWELDIHKAQWTKLTPFLSCPESPGLSLPILEGPSMTPVHIDGMFCLIISGGIRGGTEFVRVDPVERTYFKLDIQGGTTRSRQLAEMVYSNGYIYIFGGISVWPRGGVHEVRETYCIAKILDKVGKSWEWVRRDVPTPDRVPELGYALGACLVCNETKILLVPGFTSENVDTLNLSSPKKRFILFDLYEWTFSTQSNPQGTSPGKVSKYSASPITSRSLPSDQHLIIATFETEEVRPACFNVTKFYKYTLAPNARFDLLHIPEDGEFTTIHLVTIDNTILVLGMKDHPKAFGAAVLDLCVELRI